MFAGCALRLIEFRHIAVWLNTGTGLPGDARIDELLGVQRHIQAAARRLPWEPKCFERSIAAKMMLRRRKICAKLYLGVKKEGDRFVAHAWLEHEEAEGYVKLACF